MPDHSGITSGQFTYNCVILVSKLKMSKTPPTGLSWDDLLAHRSVMVESHVIPRIEELIASCGVRLNDDQLWQLIEDDLKLRRHAGQPVDEADYANRFPALRELLAKFFASRMASDSSSATTPTHVFAGGTGDSKLNPRSAGSSTSGVPLPGRLKKFVPGTRFGVYQIEEILGQGGMGVVYKAKHTVMGRRVALKVVAEKPGINDALLQRFRREAKVVARLNHPNIVAAFDADDVDGIPYLALEYVPGTDLSNVVKTQGPVPIATGVDYVIQVAQGLGYAHEKGVVHRDIKPSNLLLDSEQGVVKVLDLGLARVEALLDEASRPTELTSTGAMFGTVDFMAPEQARDAKRADARADIYSLGCTLYFLLTGKMVYPSDNLLHKIRAHRDAPIPSLRDVLPDASEKLDATFRRMIAKDPADRFPSMAEVVTSLQQAQEVLAGNRPDDAPTVIQATVLIAAKPRPKRRTWLAGVLAGIAVFGIACGLMLLSRKPSEPRSADAGAPDDLAVTTAAPVEADVPATVDVQPPYPLDWEWPRDFPPPAAAPFDVQQAVAHQTSWSSKLGVPISVENTLGMSFTLIPPGEFDRGAPGDVFGLATPGNFQGQLDSHRPVSRVRLTHPIRMGRHEVTREQFQQFVEATGYKSDAERTGQTYALQPPDGSWLVQPGFHWREPAKRNIEPGEPVTQVTWSDAQAFCGWLSLKEGVTYRLPTEAEWEFACRAGSPLRFGVVDTAAELEPYAWADGGFHQPADQRQLAPHPVGLKQPNAFGLLDMLGNVWEICHDSFAADYYNRAPLHNPATAGGGYCSIRGGSYLEGFATANPATRTAYQLPYPNTGFRIVQELPIPSELRASLGPQVVPAGSGLSARANVQRPASLTGLRSWSIELASNRSAISSIACSAASGQIAVCSGVDSNIRIYDLQLNFQKLLVGIDGNPSGAMGACLAWSPDGKLLATVDWGDFHGNGLRIWDVASGAVVLHRPSLAAWNPSISWSPDGRHLLAGGHAAELVDVQTGLSRFLAGNLAQRVTWSPDGKLVAVADNNSIVTVYNPATLQIVQGLTTAKTECRPPFAWSPDGKQFVTGSIKPNEALLFDGATLAFQKELAVPQTASQFLWTTDSKQIVLAGPQTLVWDLAENKVANKIAVGGAIDWLKPNESLVIGRSDGLLEVRSIAGLPLARTQDRGRPRPLQAALRPDGQEIAVELGTDLQFLNGETGELIEKLPNAVKAGAIVSWSPRGDFLGAAYDKELSILDRKTGKAKATASGHEAAITSHCWSADGTRLVSTSHDKTVRVWNAADGKELARSTFEEPVLDAAWSNSGQTLAVALQQAIVLLSADAGQVLSRHRFPGAFSGLDMAGQHGLAWSQDDSLLTAANAGHPLLVLDVVAGKIIPFHRNLPAFTSRGAMAWSPDNLTLLGHSDYHEGFLYDVADRTYRRLSYTYRPQWLPDSRRIFSEGFGALELWGIDTRTSQRVGTAFPTLTVGDQPLVISADGHFRGAGGSVLYAAQTEQGGLLTLSPAQFEKRYGWKNNPDQAGLLRLPTVTATTSEATEVAEESSDVFATLPDPRWRSIDLPPQTTSASGRSVSPTALVPRPAPIAGLRTWTVDTAGHRGYVDQVVYSPTGKLIATGGEDGTIRLWSPQGRLQRMLADAFNGVQALEWSNDGRYLASLHDRKLRVWDIRAGQLLRTVELPMPVHSLSWAPNASRIAIGFESRWGVLDASTGLLDERLSPGPRVTWSPDGRQIAVGNGLGITIWDAAQLVPREIWTVPQDVTGLGTLSWSPDGKRIAGTFGWNTTRIGVWDASTGQYAGDMDPRTGVTSRLRWSGDSQRLSSGFHVWDITSRRAVASSMGYDKRTDLSPAGDQVASMSGTRLVIRNLLSGAVLAEGPEGAWGLAPAQVDLVADGKTLVLQDGFGQSLVDPISGKPREELMAGPWQAIVASPRGDLMAAKSEGSLGLLYADGRPNKALVGHTDHISELAWSADGRRLATGGRDGTLRIWDPAQDQPLRTFDHSKKWVCGIAWSPDGTRIASIAAGLEPLRIWNLESDIPEQEWTLFPEGAGGLGVGGNLDWTPDGKTILIGRPSLPALEVDAATGSVQELPLRGTRVLASPDGRQQGSASSVMNSDRAEFPLLPDQQLDRLSLLKWFPDSQRLLLVGAGGVRAFSTHHHRLLGTILPGLSRGNRLVIGPEGHVRFSPASRGEIVYLAVTDSGQQVLLTPAEFEQKYGWKNLPDQATLADLTGEPEPDSIPPIQRYEEDRAAAVAVRAKLGRVRIRSGGSEREIGPLLSLPPEPFEVVGVYFYLQPIANDDLAFLKPLKSLRELSVYGSSKITDGMLENIGDHPELRRLEVHGTALTEAGLRTVTRFPKLEYLQLDGLPVTDQLVSVLAQLPRLAFLQMGGPELSDATIRDLAVLPALNSLTLTCPKATDASAMDFARMKSLQVLSFNGPVGAAFLKGLGSLPSLSSLSLTSSKPMDDAPPDLGAMVALRSLSLNVACLSDEALRRIRDFPVLDSLSLANASLTDAGLQDLLQSRSLKSLSLQAVPKLTPAANEPLVTSSIEYLGFNGVALTDDSLRQVLRSRSLKSLALYGATMITGVGFDAADGTPLDTLRLHSTSIAAEHAGQFARLKRLRALHADEPIISTIAAGLEQLPLLNSVECHSPKSLVAFTRLKQVKYLYLYNAIDLPVGEYPNLAGMDNLDQLRVFNANFTLEHFAALVPMKGKRTLYLQNGQTTQAALDTFKAQARNWTVVLEGCEVK